MLITVKADMKLYKCALNINKQVFLENYRAKPSIQVLNIKQTSVSALSSKIKPIISLVDARPRVSRCKRNVDRDFAKSTFNIGFSMLTIANAKIKHIRVLKAPLNKFILGKNTKNLVATLKDVSFAWQGLTPVKSSFLCSYKEFFFPRGSKDDTLNTSVLIKLRTTHT
ncbi:hypothetical protein VB735_15190 [Halotia wernerae UHCC 0503]|nr:hypothetical protein [Halotia wernerae UHCC 0503]